jgi:hypothetical protein
MTRNRKKAASRKPEQRPSQRTKFASISILSFPAFRTMRYNFCLSQPVYGILLEQLEQTSMVLL